jgi:hypothetical protein
MTAWCLAILCVLSMLLAGCKGGGENERDSIAPGEVEKWNDPNFSILTINSFNYTDDDIFGLYVLPTDKNDIAYAARGSVGTAIPRGANHWEGGGSGPALAWDRRWSAPRKFKVWWKRVFDQSLYNRSGPYPQGGGMFDPFDPYTTKQARPGSAWCEAEVEIKEQFGQPFGSPYPNLVRDKFVLYFYPDGTVQGHLEFSFNSDISLVEIAERDQLPVLKGRPCLNKEVPNPLYGKRRPISIN